MFSIPSSSLNKKTIVFILEIVHNYIYLWTISRIKPMNNHHLRFPQDCIEFDVEKNDLESNYSLGIK